VPPQIKWLSYCPQQQFTEYITREHTGACDLFASAGDHHIKLWSFRRPSGSGDMGSLQVCTKCTALVVAVCLFVCLFVPAVV
jgi:hypothetical protein